jgi:membrane-bound lytic murein transglycosylase D
VQKLKTVFHREGVPEALVWMAEVESGFDARAQSPAGAVGMFQLMPMTARQYGLSLWPWDQRRQPEPSARAAARYLRHLHTRFGDWRLAVAAYNSGPGTVQRLLQRQGANDLERIASHLPAETQMYVPKVEATILRREGKKLATLKTP